MRARTDLIAAIATPRGRGGIGIVRVAGHGLEAVIRGVLGRAPEPRVARFAPFLDGEGRALDEGIALFFPGPHSYTGDDVLELQGHGGRAVQDALLARVLALGARLAEPGEFTQRAFLNGRMDLAQAESVADLIDAATSTAARAAARSLTGEFSRAVDGLHDALVELRMFIEATLDFPDEDIAFVDAHDVAGRLATLRTGLDRLAARARTGALLREGLTVVLVGRPNVGKSSLMNRLVRDEAAIVTPVPGTTRDTIERPMEIAGIPLTLVDTAGLRETEDAIERAGIERTHGAIARADLAIAVVEARGDGGLDGEDEAVVARLPGSLPRIVVENKVDLVAGRSEGTAQAPGPAAGGAAAVQASAGRERAGRERHVRLSALTGEGLDALERAVLEVVGAVGDTDDAFLARERHLAALREAARELGDAALQLAAPRPALELAAESLRRGHDALASITGSFTADDLLGVIFSRFCIGK